MCQISKLPPYYIKAITISPTSLGLASDGVLIWHKCCCSQPIRLLIRYTPLIFVPGECTKYGVLHTLTFIYILYLYVFKASTIIENHLCFEVSKIAPSVEDNMIGLFNLVLFNVATSNKSCYNYIDVLDDIDF